MTCEVHIPDQIGLLERNRVPVIVAARFRAGRGAARWARHAGGCSSDPLIRACGVAISGSVVLLAIAITMPPSGPGTWIVAVRSDAVSNSTTRLSELRRAFQLRAGSCACSVVVRTGSKPAQPQWPAARHRRQAPPRMRPSMTRAATTYPLPSSRRRIRCRSRYCPTPGLPVSRRRDGRSTRFPADHRRSEWPAVTTRENPATQSECGQSAGATFVSGHSPIAYQGYSIDASSSAARATRST